MQPRIGFKALRLGKERSNVNSYNLPLWKRGRVWFKALALKARDAKASVGSNPTASVYILYWSDEYASYRGKTS